MILEQKKKTEGLTAEKIKKHLSKKKDADEKTAEQKLKQFELQQAHNNASISNLLRKRFFEEKTKLVKELIEKEKKQSTGKLTASQQQKVA